MGSSTAWWLARRGVDVVLLEQFEQGHVRGSSHGGSRIFRLAYPEPDYVALAQRALPLWRELEDDAGVPLLDTTGGLDHGDVGMIEQVEAALASCGATSERLSPDAARERWPEIAFDRAVLFQPDAGTVPLRRHRARTAGSGRGARRARAVRRRPGDGVGTGRRCRCPLREGRPRGRRSRRGGHGRVMGRAGRPRRHWPPADEGHPGADRPLPAPRRRRMAELHPPPRRRGRGRRVRASHAGRGHQGRWAPRGCRSPIPTAARSSSTPRGSTTPCVTPSSGSPESSPFQCSA